MKFAIKSWKISRLIILLGVFSAARALGQEALLRFSPEAGRTYRYSYSVNLDKTTFRKTSNEQIEAFFLLNVLGKEKGLYQTRWHIFPGRHNLQSEVMEGIKEKASRSRSCTISEQYIFDPEDGQSLFLPKKPVPIGTAWEGRPPLDLGDLTTSEPPRFKQEYRLVRVETNSAGRVAVIEGTPLDKKLTVPLEVGQLGIRCDEQGAIVQFRKGTEAGARLRVGDRLIAMNGRECRTPESRSLLAQRVVEPLHDLGSNITVTVLRDGARIEAEIPKTAGTLGLCDVEIVELRKRVEFHLDKGLVLSDVTTAQFSLNYQFLQEGGFIDDFQGGAVSGRLAKAKMPPRIYKYVWRLQLE